MLGQVEESQATQQPFKVSVRQPDSNRTADPFLVASDETYLVESAEKLFNKIKEVHAKMKEQSPLDLSKLTGCCVSKRKRMIGDIALKKLQKYLDINCLV